LFAGVGFDGVQFVLLDGFEVGQGGFGAQGVEVVFEQGGV